MNFSLGLINTVSVASYEILARRELLFFTIVAFFTIVSLLKNMYNLKIILI